MAETGLVKAIHNIMYGRESKIAKKHAVMVEKNAVVAEYAELIEGVADERAGLLLIVSKMQLEMAELKVSKALYADLEEEMAELREVAETAQEMVRNLRLVTRQLSEETATTRELKEELSVVRGKLTRLQNKTPEAGYQPTSPIDETDAPKGKTAKKKKGDNR